MKLSELQTNDRFITASAKDKSKADRYKVLEKPKFNRGHGSATRECLNETKEKIESKSCRMEIIKLPFTTSQVLEG